MKKLIVAGILGIFALGASAVDTFNIGDNTSATISGGSINNTVIGNTTPAAGTFTTLSSANASITGGAINGTTIGATTPAAGSFTTLQIGSGSTTSAGLIAGYSGISSFGAIWGTAISPSSSNYSILSNSSNTYINGSSASHLAVADTPRITVSSTQSTIKGDVILDKTITTPGTTGNQTINKTTGRVNFAAAATSLVVTNSLATANSICHVTKATNDATMRLGACVAAAGTITIYADVAPAAETAVNFTVTN